MKQLLPIFAFGFGMCALDSPRLMAALFGFALIASIGLFVKVQEMLQYVKDCEYYGIILTAEEIAFLETL